MGNQTELRGTEVEAPQIAFARTNTGTIPSEGQLVLGISTNTTQTSHTERTETAGVYQDMQGSGQTVQTANATLLKGQVSWGDGIHITVETPQVKATDSSPGQSKGLAGFAIADTANSLIENNPTASGKATIPEQSSRASLAQSLSTLPENMTGLEYLDQLKARKDVNWQAVELAHDRWSYHQEGLTPAGAALVSIAVAMATGGSASGLTAGLTSSVSVNTALAAGLTSLSSQAAVALINNQGDIGKTLDQLGQEKSVQNLVTAMVTAGALDKLGKSDWLTFDGHKLSEIGLQPGQVQDFSANLFKNAVNATSSAAVSAMVSGKPFDENSLADALGSALVTTSTAFGAKGIGDAYSGKDGIPPSLNDFTHKLAHAVLGCAGGAATQGSMDGCSPGAVGAVVGELAAEYYNPSGNPAKAAETVNFAKLMSALAGVIATGDGSNAQAVNTAAAMGANAAENNRMLHSAELRKLAMLAADFKRRLQENGIEISEQDAFGRLLAQATKNADSAKFSNRESDPIAQAYLSLNSGSFTVDGVLYKEFQAQSADERNNHTLFKETLDKYGALYASAAKTQVNNNPWVPDGLEVSYWKSHLTTQERAAASVALAKGDAVAIGNMAKAMGGLALDTLILGNPEAINTPAYTEAQARMGERAAALANVLSDPKAAVLNGYAAMRQQLQEIDTLRAQGKLDEANTKLGELGSNVLMAGQGISGTAQLTMSLAGKLNALRVASGDAQALARANGGLGSAANGIYIDMKPIGTQFPELGDINPHYVEGAGPGVNTNCTSCANAAHQRIKGTDLNAVASPNAGYGNYNSLLPSAPMGFTSSTTVADAAAQLLVRGEGATAPVVIQQGTGSPLHVITGVVKDGKVVFVDTQIGAVVTLKPSLTVRIGQPGF